MLAVKDIRKALPYYNGSACVFLEREKGFEPSTPGLGSRCSTTELLPHIRVIL